VVTEKLSAGASDVWLEIGFGSGEHLLGRAAEHPGICCIGCEPFQDGVVKVLDAIETGGRQNIRLYSDDARDLMRVLPPGCIGRAFVLFPDPWPKRRHVKRRLLSRRTFTLLADVMRSGAELRIATDIGDYATGILLAAREEGSFRWRVSGASSWRERPPGWIRTRYEEKAMAAGRRCYFLSFERRKKGGTTAGGHSLIWDPLKLQGSRGGINSSAAHKAPCNGRFWRVSYRCS
jgi:tRNA (guanine-N7-)-methyltransferase